MKTTTLVIAAALILIAIGMFSFLKKPTNKKKSATQSNDTAIRPYNEESSNLIYNLLFCDNLEWLKKNTNTPDKYPFNILFADNSSESGLQSIIDDPAMDPRIKIFACNKLRAGGHIPAKKELYGVIVELGLDDGTDVLATFSNGTARYINQSGKMIVWESTNDETASKLIADIFRSSREAINKMGPWDKPRKPQPQKGMARITYLVSDGLYFSEGPGNVLFADPISAPPLANASALLMFLLNTDTNNK